MSEVEIAGVLEISPTAVKRDWVSARAWLRSQLDATPQLTSE
jgi:hypothetical protein